jgi:hypothetical protein
VTFLSGVILKVTRRLGSLLFATGLLAGGIAAVSCQSPPRGASDPATASPSPNPDHRMNQAERARDQDASEFGKQPSSTTRRAPRRPLESPRRDPQRDVIDQPLRR